jgi:hypothetical protein
MRPDVLPVIFRTNLPVIIPDIITRILPTNGIGVK